MQCRLVFKCELWWRAYGNCWLITVILHIDPPEMKTFGADIEERIIGGKKVTLAKKGNFIMKIYTVHTLYNVILRIVKNFLETRENIKISTHPFYHKNLGWFSWEWSKKKKFFFKKKNSKWPTQKKLIFQNRQFSKFFRQNFSDGSLE